MPLPDDVRLQQGTAISWKASGGTYVLTLSGGITNGAARQGAKGDLAAGATPATWARRWAVIFKSAVATTITTDNTEIELWWGPSPTVTAGTDNPAGLTGTDAALANPDSVKPQAQRIGSLILSSALGTGIQTQVLSFVPLFQYGMPFVINKSGSGLSTTAANHEVRLVPIDDVIQD